MLSAISASSSLVPHLISRLCLINSVEMTAVWTQSDAQEALGDQHLSERRYRGECTGRSHSELNSRPDLQVM